MNLDKLFYPKSIAVIGASPNVAGGKFPFFQAIKTAGYEGELYPVNPAHKEINGTKVYQSIEDLPKGVDLAIVQVPVRKALDTITSASKKGLKFVHFFTSGFSEIGDVELEQAMIQQARAGGTRIVGPNCLGVFCPESRVTFGGIPDQDGPGNVAFLGQSGGVTLNFKQMAESRRLELNKMISYGNQIDLHAEDYIEYFSRDDRIKAIAVYIEDVKDGRRFVEIVAEASRRKPVIVLRGGTTELGARAAASHTGAMCGSQKLFSSVLRQCRAIEVQTLEQLLDVLALAVSEHVPTGNRLGFLGAGGGMAVLSTDQAASHGFSMPELEESTKELINQKIPPINTSAENPVDLGAYGRSFAVMVHTMKAMEKDKNLDVIIPYFTVEYVNTMTGEDLEERAEVMVAAIESMTKPSIPVFASYAEDDIRMDEARIALFTAFRKANLPIYRNMGEAVYALQKMTVWKSRHMETDGFR